MSSLIERMPFNAELATTVPGAPIFLTGFARSGTTWVNRLMCDYFDTGLVNEGQFIVTFGNRVQRYGDLGVVANRKKLINKLSRDEFFTIAKENYGVVIDWKTISERRSTFPGIVKDVLSQIAEQTNKHRIGSKYPVFGRHLHLLNGLFPNCKVIHVIRDGRDCALSHERMRWGHQNTYSAAFHWRNYIETIRNTSKTMRERYIEVRYEDLLLKPEIAVRNLERFITGTDDCVITRRFVEDKASLKTEKVGRWRDAMPIRSQAIFESVAGEALECCGYPLTGKARRPSLVSRMGYVAHDRVTREGWNLARKIFRNIPARK